MKCPVCGNEVAYNELFCPRCGMRVNYMSVENTARTASAETPQAKENFNSFADWCHYWAGEYEKNHAYWNYLVTDKIQKEEEIDPVIAAVFRFESPEIARKAYMHVLENGRNFGYGAPADAIVSAEGHEAWIVLISCCDLPYVILVANYFNGELVSWSDKYIQQPPMPKTAEKSLNINQYKGLYAPVKINQQIRNKAALMQKYSKAYTSHQSQYYHR